MMVDKIISGGQTGADRAALDTAIKFNILHGGFVPAARLAEDGPISTAYRLQEMESPDYPARTIRNVEEADATVIIARGELKGGTLLTIQAAQDRKKPWCHLDLLSMDEFEAAMLLHDFIGEGEGRISVLNVAGPRASQDPFIYRSVKTILEAFLFMAMTESGALDLPDIDGRPFESYVWEMLLSSSASAEGFQNTIDQSGISGGKACATLHEAVRFLTKRLPLRLRSLIANLPDRDIAALYFSMREPLNAVLGMDDGNTALYDSCRKKMVNDAALHSKNRGSKCRSADSLELQFPQDHMDIEDVVMLIIKALRMHLRQDHLLRRIK